jgi:hypothetical protein
MPVMTSPPQHAPTVMLRSLDARPNTHVSEHCIVVVVDSSRGADMLDRILQFVEELTAERVPEVNPDDQMPHGPEGPR